MACFVSPKRDRIFGFFAARNAETQQQSTNVEQSNKKGGTAADKTSSGSLEHQPAQEVAAGSVVLPKSLLFVSQGLVDPSREGRRLVNEPGHHRSQIAELLASRRPDEPSSSPHHIHLLPLRIAVLAPLSPLGCAGEKARRTEDLSWE